MPNEEHFCPSLSPRLHHLEFMQVIVDDRLGMGGILKVEYPFRDVSMSNAMPRRKTKGLKFPCHGIY